MADSLQEYRREVRAYLLDNYEVDPESIELDAKGRHAKLRFAVNGRKMVLTLNDRNVGQAGCLTEIKFQDIRRLLGAPTKMIAQSSPRTLDELTAECVKQANAIIAVGDARDETAPPPQILRWPARVALYKSGKALKIFLPMEVAEVFTRAVSSRGVELAWFESPDTWVLRHRQDDRCPLVADTFGMVVTLGGASTWEKIGSFGVTNAECWLDGGKITVRLIEPLKKTGVKIVKSPESIEPIETFDQRPLQRLAPDPATVLAAIRDIESMTSFRLTRDADQWIFRMITVIK